MSEPSATNLQHQLREVQRDLKAPKNQKNTFGGYAYRSCEDILEAVKPLLAERGLLLVLSDEVVAIGERYYVKATAAVSGDGEHVVKVSAFAREEETKKGMDAAQITGAASSYARKYALNGLFCIDDTKDADTNEQHRQAASGAPDRETPAPSRASREPGDAGEDAPTLRPNQYYNEFERKVYDPGVCEICSKPVPAKSVSFAQHKFHRTLCYPCQQQYEQELEAA